MKSAQRRRNLPVCLLTASGWKSARNQDSGLLRVHAAFADSYPSRRQVLILHEAWSSDPAWTAWRIDAYCAPDATIVIWAHSYGALVFSVTVIHELKKRGRQVDLWIVVDGVPRFITHTILPWNLLKRAMHRDDFEIPSNVKELHVHRQVNDSPRGRVPRRRAGGPLIHEYIYGKSRSLKRARTHSTAAKIVKPAASHASLDNDAEIVTAMLRLVDGMLPRPLQC